MKYGQIAGNTSINAAIYRCFEHIGEDDAKAFVKKFKEQPHDQDQIMHTFRELILGGFLASSGYQVRHEYQIGGKTPDWSILNAHGTPSCVVELTNFHPDRATEEDIQQRWQAGGTWCGFASSHTARLHDRIWTKASAYKGVVAEANVAYVVALFGEFTANVAFEEVQECLFAKDAGLFLHYPEMSGLLFFDEHGGKYRFKYTRNPQAVRAHDMPAWGEF